MESSVRPDPAGLRLVLAHDPALLLEHAADGFLGPRAAAPAAPFPSPGYLLALRQGGIRDDLLALAARRGVKGWFDPPLCIFHELPEWLGATDAKPLGDFERLVLLASVLQRTAGPVFARLQRPDAYLDALDRFFGELVAEGVAPDDYDAAFQRVAGRDAFERRRDAELAAAYRLYRDDLARAGRRDGRDTLADTAEAVRRDPAALVRRLGGRREIRIFGLQDLGGGWRVLLEALRGSPALDRIAIYTAPGVELADALDAEVVRLEEPASLAGRLFGGAGEGTCAPAPVQVIEAPDAEREIEEVARRVRQLAEDGVPLHRIAIVARQAKPYAEHALAALERFGVPATARRRIACREIPVVRAILALFAVAAEGWRRHGLVELAEQPFLGGELDASILNQIGYRRRVEGLAAWERALDELTAMAEERERREAAGVESEEERRAPLPPARRAAEARDRFAAFRERVAPLERARTLDEWLAWLADLLERDPWGIERRVYALPRDHVAATRVDLAGLRALRQILEEWRRAVASWGGGGERLDVARFTARLRELLDGDVAFATGTDRGVQVLEGFAAAYRAFDHVFLVGLEAGRFPVHAPRSPLLDEAEREALVGAGLPLERRAEWDRRERDLFRVLVAGARSLTLSYPGLDASGRETVRSVFVEVVGDVARLETVTIPASRVLTDGMPLFRDERLRGHALRAAGIERERQAGAPSRYNGRIEDPELAAWLAEEFGESRLWSPSQLESYAKCPWAYFSERLLRLEKLDDPDDDLDPALRGIILHDALRRFYEDAKARVGGPVLLRAADRDWAEPLLLEAVEAAIDEAGAGHWLGHPTLRDAKREELRRLMRRYLDFEIEENEAMFNPRKRNAPKILRTGVAEHELAFDDVTLVVDGVRFRFRGSIDRVETGIDERVESGRFVAAVDYKTTRYAAPGGGEPAAWEDGVVLQVPLYACALEQLRPGATVSRVEYRALKQRETVHSLQLYQVEPKRGEIVADEAAMERMASALDAVAGHLREVRGGSFPARPAPSCGCPSFCHAWDICRTPGGPKKKGY